MLHKAPIDNALEELCRVHENNPNKYPFEFARSAFEELWWAWIEEIKDELRKVKKLLNKDRLRKEELKMAALTPTEHGTTFFSFPDTWNLRDPLQYYQRVIEARLTKQGWRQFWQTTHKGTSLNSKKAGETEPVHQVELGGNPAGIGPPPSAVLLS